MSRDRGLSEEVKLALYFFLSNSWVVPLHKHTQSDMEGWLSWNLISPLLPVHLQGRQALQAALWAPEPFLTQALVTLPRGFTWGSSLPFPQLGGSQTSLGRGWWSNPGDGVSGDVLSNNVSDIKARKCLPFWNIGNCDDNMTVCTGRRSAAWSNGIYGRRKCLIKGFFTEFGKFMCLARWIRKDFFSFFLARSVHMFSDALAKQKHRNINFLKGGQNHIFFLEKLKSWEREIGRVIWDYTEAKLPSGQKLALAKATLPPSHLPETAPDKALTLTHGWFLDSLVGCVFIMAQENAQSTWSLANKVSIPIGGLSLKHF